MPVAPECDASQQPIEIRNDRDISGKPADIRQGRITAPEIETVVVEHLFEFCDDLGEPVVPQLLSQSSELGFAKPILSDFNIRHQVRRCPPSVMSRVCDLPEHVSPILFA